jgi:hypothetical protein
MRSRPASWLVALCFSLMLLLATATAWSMPVSSAVDEHDASTTIITNQHHPPSTRRVTTEPRDEATSLLQNEQQQPSVSSFYLRHRQLQANNYSNINMNSAEAGFIAAIVLLVLVILLLSLLCCCCCGRGGGCSLWDCVAMVCLWELCCDTGGRGVDPGGLMLC